MGVGPLGFRGRFDSKTGADVVAIPIKWGGRRRAVSSISVPQFTFAHFSTDVAQLGAATPNARDKAQAPQKIKKMQKKHFRTFAKNSKSAKNAQFCDFAFSFWALSAIPAHRYKAYGANRFRPLG